MKLNTLTKLQYQELPTLTNNELRERFGDIVHAQEDMIDGIHNALTLRTVRTVYNQNKVLRLAKSINMVYFGKRMMEVPRGFKGDMLRYRNDLSESNAVLVKLYKSSMPRYMNALATMVEDRELKYALPAEFSDSIKTNMDNTATYFSGDKEWGRIKNTIATQSDLVELVMPTYDEIASDDFLTRVEHDLKVTSVYFKNLNKARGDDASFDSNLKATGKVGYQVAELIQAISARAWETGVLFKVIQELRGLIIKVA